MISRQRVRELALALPESTEQDHHGRPSFRVAGKIFATLWDEDHMNVMLDEPGILTAVETPRGARRSIGASAWPPSTSSWPPPTRH